MRTPLRAAQVPGCTTLWTRTLDRLLAQAEAPAPRPHRQGGVAAVPEMAAGPAKDDGLPRAVALAGWAAPAWLPEVLAG
jgi:hypothetical protein